MDSADDDRAAHAGLRAALLDAVPAPIVAVDAGGKVMVWNAAAARLFGWATEEVEGHPDPTIPSESSSEEALLREEIFAGDESRRETRRLRRDGSLLDVLAVTTAVCGEQRHVIAAVTTYEDLAAARAVEGIFRASEERTRLLVDSVTGLAVLIVAPDGRVLDANASARELLGRGDRPLTGQPIDHVWFPEALPSDRMLAIARHHGRLALETRTRLPDGSTIWTDILISTVGEAAGGLSEMIVVLRNITTQRIERELQEQRAAQNAALADFAQRAMVEEDVDELTQEALQHIAAAVQGDVAEMLQAAGDDAFVISHHFAWDGDDPSGLRIARDGGAIVAEAAAQGVPVSRELTAADFEAAPYLAARGLRFGAATAITSAGQVCAFAVYTRDRLLSDPDLYALQAIAAMFAAAKARRLAERQVAESATSLRLMFDQIPAVLWSVDRDLEVTWSQGSALQTMGKTSADFVGRLLTTIVPDGSPPVRAMRGALRGESATYQYRFEGRSFDNRVQPLRDAKGTIVGAVALAFDVTERTMTEEALRGSREELRRLSAELNRIQESERRRIAREVHDELGQRLTALRLDLLLLRNALPSAEPLQVETRIAAMLALIDETIDTVRRVATALRPSVLDDFGFRAAVENELAMLRKRTGIDYTISFIPDDYAIDGDRATALFRIVQELLTNVARHAEATTVEVRLAAQNGWIYLDVRDNGRGIAAAEVDQHSSLGLVGVRERAFAFGGDVLITGDPAGGTHVAVRIPEKEPT